MDCVRDRAQELGATLGDDYSYKPPSDISGGSANSYNQHLSTAMLHNIQSRVASQNLKLAEMESQRLRIAELERQTQRIPELEKQLAAVLGGTDPTNDTLARRLERSENAAETNRRKSEALRKQVSRLQNKSGPGGQVEHYRRPVSGCNETIVLSTEMIANENEERRMDTVRAQGPDSDQSAPGPPQLDAPPCSNPGKRSRSGTQHSYSNHGTEKVTLILPGPNRNRAGGGTEKAESALLPMIFAFNETNMSVNAIINAAVTQNGAGALEVHAVFQPRKGHGRRLACPTGTEDKPVNVLGNISAKTFINGLHAFSLGMDKLAVKEGLVRSADTLTVNIDISSFNEHAQLGVVLHMMYIKKSGWTQ